MNKEIIIPDRCELCHFDFLDDNNDMVCTLYNMFIEDEEEKPHYCKAKTVEIKEEK